MTARSTGRAAQPSRPPSAPLEQRAGLARLALGGTLLSATAGLVTGALVCLTRAPLLLLGREAAAGRLSSLPFGDLLAGLCAAALAGCWLWCLLSGTAVAVGAVAECRAHPRALAARAPGRAPRPVRMVVLGPVRAPRPVRVVVLAALGLPLTALAAPAHAVTQPGSPGASQDAPAAVTGALSGLPLPDRVVSPRQAPAPQPAVVVRRSTPLHVVVRPGDCLWSLAARLVTGPRAEPAVVAAAVRELRVLNEPALGPDPDLIFPGTRLVLPSPAAPSGKEHP